MAQALNQKQYGLLLERRSSYGTEYVVAWLTSRNGDKPYGCSTDGEREWDKEVPLHVHGLQLDGLCMHGFVSDLNDCQFIGFAPEYRSVYAVDRPKAERMVRTLKKVQRQIEKDSAYESGDVFSSLAKALKLDFVCERKSADRGSSWDQSDWRFMTVAEGRNRYRSLIEETVLAERKRLGKAVA